MKDHDNCVTPLQIQSMANALYTDYLSKRNSSPSLFYYQNARNILVIELSLLRKLVEITSQDFETIELIIGYLKQLNVDGVGRPPVQPSAALGQGGN